MLNGLLTLVDTSYGASVCEEYVGNAEDMCNPETWGMRTEKPARLRPGAWATWEP